MTSPVLKTLTLNEFLAALTHPSALLETAVTLACLGAAWAIVRVLRGPASDTSRSVWFGRRLVDGVLFPVLALLKGVFVVALIYKLFPAEVQPEQSPPEFAAMSVAEKRLAVILTLALLLWMTDSLHGVRAGWVALAAGLACLLPRIGVLPPSAFNDVKLGPFFYVGASIGLGAVVHESGLGEVLGKSLLATLDLQHGADFSNFMYLSVLNALAGAFVTNPALPAVTTALAAPFAEAAGWPLAAAIMTIAVGYNVMFLPYQVPPAIVGLHACRMLMRDALRVTLPVALAGIVVFMPLEYLWWRVIGYFG